MGSAKVIDIGWPLKGQEAMSKVRCGLLLTWITHNVSIPENASKFRGWTRFPWKVGRRRTSYHVIAPSPDLNRWKSFSLRMHTGYPYAMENFSAINPVVRRSLKKLIGGGGASPSRLHGRGLTCHWNRNIIRDLGQKMTTSDQWNYILTFWK